VSRRKRRAGGAPAAPSGGEPVERRGLDAGGESGRATSPGQPGGRTPGAARADGPAASGAAPASSRRVAVDVAVLIAVFAVTAGIAELAGAANLGVALGVGQVAFAIALVVLLLRG